jgi:hypothetical protein
MTLTLTRRPQGTVDIRANICINPKMSSYSNWQSSGSGANSPAATDTYSAAGKTLEKYWNAGAPSNVNDAGWFYDVYNAIAGNWTASAYVYYQGWEPKMVCKAFFYNGNTLIGNSVGGAIQCYFDTVNTGWRRIWHTFTVPAGCTRYAVQFSAVEDGFHRPPQGQGMALNRCLIEAGTTLSDWFDGDLYANGNGQYATRWEGTAGASRSLMSQLNPATVFSIPQLADRISYQRLSRSTTHVLMNGATAGTLMQGTLRTGVMKLLVPDDAVARNLGNRLMEAAYWNLVDDTHGELGMDFMVTGGQAVAVYQDDARDHWVVEVPFSELGL